MNQLRRVPGRLRRAYQLHCAREDARLRHIITPAGVWVCHHCPQVSLTQLAFTSHLAAAHL
jgi:hypothetical protein